MNAVDRVILLDTVRFSRPNWINRNRLANAHGLVPFSFPVRKVPSTTSIHAMRLADPELHQRRFLRTLQTIYGKAPYFERGYATAERAFRRTGNSLGDLATDCVHEMARAFAITTPMHRALGRYPQLPCGANNLVIHICRQEKADGYINPEGGQHLYSARTFKAAGISLQFLRHLSRDYPRGTMPFFPRLSALDALMFCSDQELAELLGDFQIVQPKGENRAWPT